MQVAERSKYLRLNDPLMYVSIAWKWSVFRVIDEIVSSYSAGNVCNKYSKGLMVKICPYLTFSTFKVLFSLFVSLNDWLTRIVPTNNSF